jgi:hypothetical protein
MLGQYEGGGTSLCEGEGQMEDFEISQTRPRYILMI